MEKLSINQWAEEDRPREKLERLGPSALTNAELLAILIGSGSQDESAVDLMKRVLKACNNNLNTLGKKSVQELVNPYKGMGKAKAITILAACELGKRRSRETAEERKDLGSATAIYNYMHTIMQDLEVEQAWILMMNNNFKLIRALQVSEGGYTGAFIDVRVILKEALLNNTTILALCHNHPSNNPKPSKEDDAVTQKMQKACETVNIHFLDHVIVTDGNYYSYREMGKI